MEIALRPYRPTDLVAMHALDARCFDHPFSFSASAMRRFAAAPKAHVVVAEEHGELVGFVIMDIEDTETGRFGYVVTLDVSPEHRRTGLAKALMQEAERRAFHETCSSIALHVFTGNDSAIGFYVASGFVKSHREADFYGRDKDAWVFHKPLLAPDK